MTEMNTVAHRLADRVSRLRFEDLPADVVEKTEQVILDQLGVQVLGATLPNVQPVLRLAAGAPLPGNSTITAGNRLSGPAQAAYVNGTLGHSCEYDDAHGLAWHTSSVVVPAALALAERENVGGRELITAVAAGIQVMGLLGAAVTTGMITTGWHGSKVLGVFGAAAAAGRSVVGLVAAGLQAIFYGLAALGRLVPGSRAHPLVKVPYFFSQVNLAILAAWLKFLRGERISLWTPSRR